MSCRDFTPNVPVEFTIGCTESQIQIIDIGTRCWYRLKDNELVSMKGEAGVRILECVVEHIWVNVSEFCVIHTTDNGSEYRFYVSFDNIGDRINFE